MLQPGRDLDLAAEPLRPDLRRELLMQHFDRDLAAMLQVFGAEHRRHPAATQLAVHGVGVGEGVAQQGQQIRQDRLLGKALV